MEPYLLHLFLSFIAGLVVGIIVMLLVNKIKTGKLSPSAVKQEYQEYQERVEEHFEQTSKKFKDMTEQYQDLYKHLSVGATSLCRPDSVAATLADESEPLKELEQKEPVAAEAPVDATPVEEKVEAKADNSQPENPNIKKAQAEIPEAAEEGALKTDGNSKQTEAESKPTS